eukprot:370669_1
MDAVKVEVGEPQVISHNKPFVVYTFYFEFGHIRHPLSARFSTLLDFHRKLMRDRSASALFHGRFAARAVFPSKRWFTDMTKPKNYEARTAELHRYFCALVTSCALLCLPVFHDQLGLDDEGRKTMVEVAQRMQEAAERAHSHSTQNRRAPHSANEPAANGHGGAVPRVESATALSILREKRAESAERLLMEAQARLVDTSGPPAFIDEKEEEERAKKYQDIVRAWEAKLGEHVRILSRSAPEFIPRMANGPKNSVDFPNVKEHSPSDSGPSGDHQSNGSKPAIPATDSSQVLPGGQVVSSGKSQADTSGQSHVHPSGQHSVGTSEQAQVVSDGQLPVSVASGDGQLTDQQAALGSDRRPSSCAEEVAKSLNQSLHVNGSTSLVGYFKKSTAVR